MNDVQKVVFESFRYFADICEKLNLEYYLVNGSALGAVKYGGFIPWDDDLDVGMPRKDYEIFIEKAGEYLPENLFLQNYRTDKRFPHLYSKLRNSDTAFIENGVKHLDMNHGIYMDIFPLDSADASFLNNKINSLNIKILFWFSFSSLDDRANLKIRFRNSVLRFMGFHKRTDRALKKLDNFVCGTDSGSLYLCNFADRQGKGKILRKWYGNGSNCIFEGISVKIPENYNDYLTYKYGDWKKELPVGQQKSHHTAIVCDTKKSYKYYQN